MPFHAMSCHVPTWLEPNVNEGSSVPFITNMRSVYSSSLGIMASGSGHAKGSLHGVNAQAHARMRSVCVSESEQRVRAHVCE